MTLQQAAALADTKTPYVSDVYKLISQSATFDTIAGDSEPLIKLPSSKIEELANIGHEHVLAQHVAHGQRFNSLTEAYASSLITLGDAASYMGPELQQVRYNNGVHNPVTKIGTMLDPSVYTQSDIPVMMSPYECSSAYAPGGLPAAIIDKKSRAMIAQGATFKALRDFWDNDKINELEEAAATTGFNDVVADAICDAFIYGGSILYPVFKGESASSFKSDMYRRTLQKECIERWVTVDRWNTVIVPSYIVTDADYLTPKSLYIPLGAVEISTSRMAIIKPKPLPYWISLYNIGWGPSDFSGWIRAYFNYEIVCQSVPIMAQQMSLILYKMPLDALNATIGPDKVEKLMAINEQKMAEWSALSPKAVNMVGDVEVVDRTYSGFDQFVGVIKSNLASQCGIPEPSLWHTPNKGFSDNTTESLLKQSETLQMLQHFVERRMVHCTDALIAHQYGTDSEEWKNRRFIQMTFNKPVISTEKDLAEVGARFAASVSSLTQAGVSPDIAMKLSSQFFPTVKITQEMMDMAKKSYDEVMDKQMANKVPGLGSGQGNTKASSGSGKTTGSFTKAK